MEKNNISSNTSQKLILLVVIIISLFLASCTDTFSKKEAYCFSTVFDKDDTGYIFSVFCKVPSDENAAEESKLTNMSFDFKEKNPPEAVKQSENYNYEIYYKSCLALFFSDAISDTEVRKILVQILNNTKYQSNVYIFKDRADVVLLRQEAEKISTNEKIDFTSKDSYVTLTEYIKEKNF